MAKMLNLAKKSWEGWEGLFGENGIFGVNSKYGERLPKSRQKSKWHAKEPFESGKYDKNSSKPFNYMSNKMVNYKLL